MVPKCQNNPKIKSKSNFRIEGNKKIKDVTKIGYFEGLGQVKIVLGSTHIVQHLLFSLCPSILAVNFDLILGFVLDFLGPNGLFLGSMWGSKICFGVHSCS